MIGLYYSYVTCGTDSTFEDWFGVNGTAASSNNLDDLADVVEDYIKALRTDIEDTYQEYSTLTTSCENTHTGCPCSTCELTPGWGAGIMVDFDSTMFKPHAVTPATPRSTCLSQSMHSFFTKIAGSEYHDTSKFANLYGGVYVLHATCCFVSMYRLSCTSLSLNCIYSSIEILSDLLLPLSLKMCFLLCGMTRVSRRRIFVHVP